MEILSFVHDAFRFGRFVGIAAEVQQSMYDYALHFAFRCRSEAGGVVGDGFDVDENISACPFLFRIAVVERDYVGVVVVTKELTVHLQQSAGRAEDVVELPDPKALRSGTIAEPGSYFDPVSQDVFAVVRVESDSHSMIS